MIKSQNDELSAQDIVKRMNAGIRKALNTPPNPAKYYVGASKKSKSQSQYNTPKVNQSKSKDNEAS